MSESGSLQGEKESKGKLLKTKKGMSFKSLLAIYFILVVFTSVFLSPAAFAAFDWEYRFFLNAPNTSVLPVQYSYASITVQGDINAGLVKFTVNPLTVSEGGVLTPSGNFGVQEFGFNSTLSFPPAVINLPAGWSAVFNSSVDGFSIFNVDPTGSGGTRKDPLVFTVTSLTAPQVDIDNFYIRRTQSQMQAFAAHIAGYTSYFGTSSAFFGDNASFGPVNPTGTNGMDVYDATGIPPLGDGTVTDPSVIYATIRVTESYEERTLLSDNGTPGNPLDDTYDANLYLKETKTYNDDEVITGIEFNSVGLVVTLTNSAKTKLVENSAYINDFVEFRIQKGNLDSGLLVYGTDYTITFDGNKAFFVTLPDFLENNSQFGPEEGVNFVYSVTILDYYSRFEISTLDQQNDPVKKVATSFNPINIGSASIDPITNSHIAPELPPGFVGILGIFIAFAVLYLRQRFYRIA